MRHVRVDDLDRLAPLLTELRANDALTEKSPGSFYRKSKAFLHFHIDGDDVYADVRLVDGPFDRRRVTTKTEQKALLTAIRRATSQ